MRENIWRLVILFISIFVVFSVYIGYVNFFKGPSLAASSYNRRIAAAEEKIDRGTIYDRYGKIIAETQEGNRLYPYGSKTAHVVGFVSSKYGRTGLEQAYNHYLLGMNPENKVYAFIDRLLGRQKKGNDLVTTLDLNLQEIAADSLRNRKGAAVVLDPRNGDILAAASSPSFDPGSIEKSDAPGDPTEYDFLVKDEASPLLNRAVQGAYPPGSTFKLVTAAALLENEAELGEKSINCEGSTNIDGFVLKDTAAHGDVNFDDAIALSCNTFFAEKAVKLGAKDFYSMVEDFGITGDPWAGWTRELQFRSGTLSPLKKMGKTQLAVTAIGQGELVVSPMHMALVAAAIANDGVIMKPHLLKSIKRVGSNAEVLEYNSEEWLEPITSDTAKKIRFAMVETVERGTGAGAALQGIAVAGKTGSAQNPHGNAHAWFVALAPAEEPQVVAAVMIESGGSGGREAAPIVRELIKEALKDK